MRRLYHFGADYVYSNSDISPRNRVVCDKMAIYLLTCTVRVNLMLFVSYLLLVCGPLYKNFFTDEHVMIIPVILPFIDPESDFGLKINMINQMFTVLMGFPVVPGTEIVTCVMKNNVTATAAVIENSLIELQNLVETDTHFSIKCVCELRNTILKILDFDRFGYVNACVSARNNLILVENFTKFADMS